MNRLQIQNIRIVLKDTTFMGGSGLLLFQKASLSDPRHRHGETGASELPRRPARVLIDQRFDVSGTRLSFTVYSVFFARMRFSLACNDSRRRCHQHECKRTEHRVCKAYQHNSNRKRTVSRFLSTEKCCEPILSVRYVNHL